MIGKNLKVGEKFTDGNRTLEVLAVVEEGVYISKVVEVKTEETSFTATITEKVEPAEKKLTKTDINRLSTEKLAEKCKELDLEVSTGSAMKKAIIEKLGL